MSWSSIWPILHYADTQEAFRFVVDAMGFEPMEVARDDVGDVIHTELGWACNGVVVIGGIKHEESVHAAMQPGTSAPYVTCADVDGIHERARTHGATIVAAPHHTTFGSGTRAFGFTIADHEGNLWTFGDYEGVST
jgi:uncharacterized glyoxalase superfamily protein PhnB